MLYPLYSTLYTARQVLTDASAALDAFEASAFIPGGLEATAAQLLEMRWPNSPLPPAQQHRDCLRAKIHFNLGACCDMLDGIDTEYRV